MKKISILLLCCALIFVPFATSAAIDVRGEDNISPSSSSGKTALLALSFVNLTTLDL